MVSHASQAETDYITSFFRDKKLQKMLGENDSQDEDDDDDDDDDDDEEDEEEETEEGNVETFSFENSVSPDQLGRGYKTYFMLIN